MFFFIKAFEVRVRGFEVMIPFSADIDVPSTPNLFVDWKASVVVSRYVVGVKPFSAGTWSLEIGVPVVNVNNFWTSSQTPLNKN
jgi:hypothetical protein